MPTSSKLPLLFRFSNKHSACISYLPMHTTYASQNSCNYEVFIKNQLMHINFIHNSLFLKFPYTYFGGLNHHLQGVVEII
jgi:hypothetical protein